MAPDLGEKVGLERQAAQGAAVRAEEGESPPSTENAKGTLSGPRCR